MLVLAFQVLQVASRLLISFSIETLSASSSAMNATMHRSPRAKRPSNGNNNSSMFSNQSMSMSSDSMDAISQQPSTTVAAAAAISVPLTIAFEPPSPNNKRTMYSFATPYAGSTLSGKISNSLGMQSATAAANASQTNTNRRFSTIFFSPQVLASIPDYFPDERRDYIKYVPLSHCIACVSGDVLCMHAMPLCMLCRGMVLLCR